MFTAIWEKIKKLARNFSENTVAAINEGDKWGIISAALCLLLSAFGFIGLIAGAAFLLVSNANFLFKWVALPVLAGWVLVYWFTSSKPEKDTGSGVEDPVEEELAIERAREATGDIEGVALHAIQEAAGTTSLACPRDIYEIQSSTPSGDHFYMVKKKVENTIRYIPIFQVEVALENAIEGGQGVYLRDTLQRCMVKHSARYPQIISPEAQGRPPVEVLDVKNLGGRVVIDLVRTTAASIPLIDARRRARVERRQRQQAVIDTDYPE